MQSETLKSVSLKDHSLDSIKTFIYEQNFQAKQILGGLTDVLEEIVAYKEEGETLFPKILITNNIDEIKKIVANEFSFEIAEVNFSGDEFKRILKKCAPLAVNGWVIYFEVRAKTISYGLISAEVNEFNLSFDKQILSINSEQIQAAQTKNFFSDKEIDSSNKLSETTFIYIKNTGNRTLLLKGLNNALELRFSLKSVVNNDENFNKLLESLLINIEEGVNKDNFKHFFEKTFSNAFMNGHGNLIGIYDESKNGKLNDQIGKLFSAGIVLKEKIGFFSIIKEYNILHSEEGHSTLKIRCLYGLKSFACVLQGMINFDGISIFDKEGSLLGYNFFIKSSQQDDSIGGARSRAFNSMEKSKMFEAGYFKSQDGNDKFFKL